MAYTVLARRYRSGTFDELIGQDHVAQTLKKAITSGRIAHAYLFTGTRGVGKTSSARILAKALNCLSTEGPTVSPCGTCSSCVATSSGEDIDVIEIDAASNTGVDNVRQIIENARFKPARSRFKVYIIDEVHMLTKQAFNALLKIMEEPPEHVKFILATTEVDKILPTILSRCQRYDFRAIPTREIHGHLARICREEKVDADDEALAQVARAGAGSMRDALSLLDRLLSVGESKLTSEVIERLLGVPRQSAIESIVDAIASADVRLTLEGANALLDNGLSTDTLIASLIDHLHRLLVARTCGRESQLVDIAGISADRLFEQAARFEPAGLSQSLVLLEELRRQMRSSQAGRALLDASLARLAMSGEFDRIDELLARIDQPNTPAPRSASPQASPPASPQVAAQRSATSPPPVQRSTISAPTSSAQASSSSPPSQASVSDPEKKNAEPERTAVAVLEAADAIKPSNLQFGDLDQLLAGLIQKFPPRAQPHLAGAKLRSFAAGVMKLHYPAAHAEYGLLVRERRSQYTKLFAEHMGQPVTLEVDVEEPLPTEVVPSDRPREPLRKSITPAAPKPDIEAVAASIDPAETEVKADYSAYEAIPLVRAAIDAFEARVVRVDPPD